MAAAPAPHRQVVAKRRNPYGMHPCSSLFLAISSISLCCFTLQRWYLAYANEDPCEGAHDCRRLWLVCYFFLLLSNFFLFHFLFFFFCFIIYFISLFWPCFLLSYSWFLHLVSLLICTPFSLSWLWKLNLCPPPKKKKRKKRKNWSTKKKRKKNHSISDFLFLLCSPALISFLLASSPSFLFSFLAKSHAMLMTANVNAYSAQPTSSANSSGRCTQCTSFGSLVPCSFCDKPACNSCCRLCDRCQDVFCNVCSVPK